MNTRQATLIVAFFALLLGLSACSSSQNEIPTATVTSPPPTETSTPTAIPPTPTATPLTCLTQPGRVEQGVVTVTVPPQEYLIYLPPCYNEQTDKRYPVLYLLHGQTYTDDQWVRLGIPQAADQLFISGESAPFIIVFPDDHLWNNEAGSTFGQRLIGALIPYIDSNYRTLPTRDNRALGGLSRGGGWTVQLGFENPQLFGSLGLHSPAIFKDNAPFVERIIKSIPEESRPRLWIDAGDNDRELSSILDFERMLTRNEYPHEFHFYTGDHSEIYWGAHVRNYLLWYAEAWNEAPADQ
jgi:enterochelin esterase-like enzyme